jgi:hypothetical protein
MTETEILEATGRALDHLMGKPYSVDLVMAAIEGTLAGLWWRAGKVMPRRERTITALQVVTAFALDRAGAGDLG